MLTGVRNERRADMKVLIADDQPRMRACIREALRPLRAEVVETGDGEAAIRAFAVLQPDWTLMDLEMPNMDGMTATAILCRRFPFARVLILTGHDSPALRSAAWAAGAWGYSLKSELHLLSELLRTNTPAPTSAPPRMEKT